MHLERCAVVGHGPQVPGLVASESFQYRTGALSIQDGSQISVDIKDALLSRYKIV